MKIWRSLSAAVIVGHIAGCATHYHDFSTIQRGRNESGGQAIEWTTRQRYFLDEKKLPTWLTTAIAGAIAAATAYYLAEARKKNDEN